MESRIKTLPLQGTVFSSTEQQKTNNKPLVGRRIAASAVSAAILTPICGIYCAIENGSSSRQGNETLIQHIIRDTGEDLQRFFTKLFDRLSCSKLADKINGIKPKSIAKIWFGTLFSAIFIATYLLFGNNKNKQ